MSPGSEAGAPAGPVTAAAMAAPRPVFVDDGGRRRRRWRVVGVGVTALGAAYLVAVVGSLVGAPWASRLPWPGGGSFGPAAPQAAGTALGRAWAGHPVVAPWQAPTGTPATAAAVLTDTPAGEAGAASPATTASAPAAAGPGASQGSPAAPPATTVPAPPATAPGRTTSGTAPASSTATTAPGRTTSATTPGRTTSATTPGRASTPSSPSSSVPGGSANASSTNASSTNPGRH